MEQKQRLALILLVATGLALAPALVADAATFRVTPIRVDLSRTSRSALLTLMNDSNEEIRFQISGFEWTQSPTGELKLSPSAEVIFFPTLVTLKGGEERKVRVGITAAPGAVEKTYRVFFEEIPGLQKQEARQGSQVRILTKMGIPIFVEPTDVKAQGEIRNAAIDHGKLRFDVANGGTVHYMLQKVHVTGKDSAGKTLFDQDRDGWYVLAGSFRSYDIEVPPAVCSSLKSIHIEAQTDLGTKPEQSLLTRDVAVPANACSEAK